MVIGKLIDDSYRDKYDKAKFIRVYENVIIAKGGDGTLLKAIKKYRHLNLPFWGVNAGTLGFLMNSDMPENITERSDVKVSKFNLIKAVVTYRKLVRDMASIGNKEIIVTEEFQAFNDIMIGGDMNSWIQFDVKEKDDFFGKFNAGGLIISSPQGSTGINKNNGGVILPLSSSLWSITGDKASRQIEYVIKPRKIEVNVKSRTKIMCWVDGSNHIIRNVDKVVLTRGDSVQVIFGDYSEFKKKRRV